MANQEDAGRLRRRRRRLAQGHDEHTKEGEKSKADLPDPYGFLHLLSLILQHDIPILFPGSERPRSAYGLLGSGASFLVFKEERSMDSLPILHGKRRSLEDRMVLKRTRQFTDLETSAVNASNARYRSIIAELLILLDPLVQENEYIIDLHGLTWDYEPNSTHEMAVTVWPVLALEAAESTMLALKVEFDLSEAPLFARLEYCFHIASGLGLLHSRGVVHCDVKLENILICVTERSGSVAKISDFGSAILNVNDESYFPNGIAGTPPWTSPEFRRPLQGPSLFKTDVYSFGMLLWQFLSDSSSQTNLESLDERDLRDRIQILNELKDSNDIADVAIQELRANMKETAAMEIVFRILKSTLAFDPEQRSDMETVSSLLSQALNEALQSSTSSVSASPLEDYQSNEPPNTLNLEEIKDDVDSDSIDIPWKILPIDTEPFFTEFERVYEVLEEEAPLVKGHIVKCLKECVDLQGVSAATVAEAAYQLVLCHTNGFGTQKSLVDAERWMIRAARSGSLKAKADAYLLLQVVSPVELSSSNLRSESIGWLQTAMENGSASAARVLQTIDPELHKQTLDSWSKRFFDLSHISKLDQCLNTENSLSRSLLHDMASGKILDERGNQCIHYAAMSGNIDLLELLQQENASMNSTNTKGETALLCACRSNQAQAVSVLLRMGVNTEPAASGESPLHWLIAIEEKNHVSIIASELVAAGAALEQQYKRTEDNDMIFDVYPHGTPLDWAVSKRHLHVIETLIALGADPFNECSQYSAFTRAASAHDWEVLCVLRKSRHVTTERMSTLGATGNSILFEAIYCYPPYDRIMLHGNNLRSAAVKTVKHLIDAGCQPSCLDRDGSTVLHVLAGFGSQEFLEWFFDDLDLVQYINVGVGRYNRVPIHNAMAARDHEIFEFLLSRGADLSTRTQDLTVLHLLALTQDQDFATKCLQSMQLHDQQDLSSLANMPTNSENMPAGGMTAFELAVHNGNLRVASKLLEAGPLPYCNNERDLHFVAYLIALPTWTSVESLKYYLEKAECPFIARKSTSLSVLHVAASGMQPLHDVITGQQKLDILLELFPHIDQIDAETTSSTEPGVAAGQTPLHYAAKFGVSYAVDKLLSVGANPFVEDANGDLPLSLAQKQLSSLQEKGLDQQYPQLYAELQSTTKKLESVGNRTIAKATKPETPITTTRSRISMLGFDLEAL